MEKARYVHLEQTQEAFVGGTLVGGNCDSGDHLRDIQLSLGCRGRLMCEHTYISLAQAIPTFRLSCNRMTALGKAPQDTWEILL